MCGNRRCVDWGTIFHPTPAMVAGIPIDLTGITFGLVKCDLCDFQFKHPVLPESKVVDCYAKSKDNNWGELDAGGQRGFKAIRDLLDQHAPNRTVLDVGCSNGAFLKFLGDAWTRFGIEPSTRAATVAVSHQIKILGKDLFDLSPERHQFDAITAIDVLEHLTHPLSFLKRAAELLTPGGIMLLQTGNSDAWPWRLEGSRHWYCSLPEHVSFFCERTLNLAAQHLGMRRIAHLRIRHRKTSIMLRLIETTKNLSYMLVCRMNGCGLRPLQTRVLHRRAPVWISARDHMIYVLGKS